MERMRKQGKRGAGGFTLVELIVVIAILAILAGVGTVAYSGYVKYAKKGVDKQTVGELIYAIQLADYADPRLLDGNIGMIVLMSDEEAQVVGSNDTAAFIAALNDSMGDTGAVRLSYSEWGTDIAAVNHMLDNISALQDANGMSTDNLGNYLGQTDENGNTVSVGYAAVANDLWEVVRGIAFGFVGGQGSYTDDPEADSYAAQYTVFTAKVTADYSTVESMTNAWTSTESGGILHALTLYNTPEGGETNETLSAATNIAGQQGPVVARHMAFAEYLEKYGTYEGVEEDVAVLRDPSNYGTDRLTATTAPASGKNTEYLALATQYLTTPVANGKSQAYIDGLAYYTFMKSIADQYATEEALGSNSLGSTVALPDNFWEDADGYITWAKAVGSGSVDIAAMRAAVDGKSGNAIIIVADKTSGTLQLSVSPTDADPRDKNEDSSSQETITCELEHNNNITATANNLSVTLKDADSGLSLSTIVLCSTDPDHKTCVIDGAINIEPRENSFLTVSGNTITAVGTGSVTVVITAANSNGVEKTKSITVTAH